MTLRDYLKHMAINGTIANAGDPVVQVDLALQKSRSLAHGITPKPGGNIVKPKLFEQVPDENFADPVNYRFPITEEVGELACEAFNVSLEMGLGYSREELEMIAETISRMTSKWNSDHEMEWLYDEYGRLVKVNREFRSKSVDEYEYDGPPNDGITVSGYSDESLRALDPADEVEIVEDAGDEQVIEIVADVSENGNGQHADEEIEIAETVDVTANTIRIRQIDPDKFNKGSFRMKRLTNGVQAVVGRLKGSTKTTVQSLVFDRKKFDVAKAKSWAKNHGFRSESGELEVELELESMIKPPIFGSIGIVDPRDLIFESVGAMRSGKWIRELFAPSGRILTVEKSKVLDDIEDGELEFITPLVLIGEYTGNNNRYSRRCVEHMRDAVAALFESSNRDFLKGRVEVESSSDGKNSVLQIMQNRFFGWPSAVESLLAESADFLLSEADQVGLNGMYANDGRLPDMYTSHEARFANLQREKCGYMREIFIEDDVGFLRARTMNTSAGRDMSVLINKNQITGVSLVGWATIAEENDRKGKDVDQLHMLGTDFTDFPGMPFRSEHARDGEKAVGLFNMVN